MIPFSRDVPNEARFIVISQDCDIVNGSCEVEPAVEVIAAVGISGLRTEYQNLRNPRELHLRIGCADGSVRPVAVHVWDRGFVDRMILTRHTPDRDLTVLKEDLDLLVDFIGRRYFREAFPDEFERRFKGAKAKFERLLRKYVSEILDVYVIVEPFEELEAISSDSDQSGTTAYRFWIYVLVPASLADDVKALNVLKNDVRPELKKAVRACRGIELEDLYFQSTADVTVDRWQKMRRIDFAAMSLEEEERARAAPHEGDEG